MSKKDKTERKSGLAIAGIYIAAFALVGSWIPILNNFSFMFAVIALACGVVGFVAIKKGKRVGQGLATATIILSLVTMGVVLATQAFYGAVVDEVGKSVNETVNDYDGTNTDKLLKNNVDVTIGKFSVTSSEYFEETKLPVTIKNKSSEKASYSVKIEAVDKDGARIADDVIYVSDLGAGQSIKETAFEYVESGKVDALKKATFKVLEVTK